MKSHDPILGRWDETVRRKGGDTAALIDPGGKLLRTFSDIEREGSQLEKQLSRMAGGAVLAVQIGNHPTWPAVLLAGLRRGLAILPLETTINATDRALALEICKAGALLTISKADMPDLQVITPDRSFEPDENKRPSLLKLTSGTTAAPRAIRFRSSQLLADCDQICDTMGISDVDLNFGVIAISHS